MKPWLQHSEHRHRHADQMASAAVVESDPVGACQPGTMSSTIRDGDEQEQRADERQVGVAAFRADLADLAANHLHDDFERVLPARARLIRVRQMARNQPRHQRSAAASRSRCRRWSR